MIHLGDTLNFRVVPGQRFLNLSVWLTGVRGDQFDLSNESMATASAARPKFSFSRLFKMQSDLPTTNTQEPPSPPEEPLKEARIGYVNVSLAEIAADCHLNTQSHHISTYQLYPADTKASLG